MAPRTKRPRHEEPQPSGLADLGASLGVAKRSRRGVRTALLSVVGVLGVAAVAVWVLLNSLGPPEGTAPMGRRGSETPGMGSGASPSVEGGPTISGTITVAPELGGRMGAAHVLFVIARRGPGPPYAVKRIADPHFPVSYQLGPENVMMAGTPFEGEVSLSARLSIAGGAGPAQPGDLEGEHPGRVTVGQRGVDLVINRVH